MSLIDGPTSTLTRPLPPPEISLPAAGALLALADDEFMIGHRHSEWLGLSPFLEEDLTVSSIAQDELGHARALYGLIWPSWRAADREAGVTRRPSEEWTSSALADRAGGPWEQALIRHWFYDTLEPLRWRAVADVFGKEVSGLEALTARVLVEERYHFHHADSLVQRLCQVASSHARLQVVGQRVIADALAMVEVIRLIDPIAAAEARDVVMAGFDLLRLSDDTSVGSVTADSRADRISDVFAQLLQVVAFDPEATW
jgi:phenylacetate-CoA oxygenase PaaI subunit